MNAFLKTHIKLGKKSETLRSYLSRFNVVFNKIKHLDLRFENLINPVLNIDKDLLKFNLSKKQAFRFKKGQFEELTQALEKTNNKAVKRVVFLCLFTAMRVNEVFYLRKEQINFDENYIFLPQTKTFSRKVYLSEETKNFILSFYDEYEDKFFTEYKSLQGLKRAFHKFTLTLSFPLKFHDLRKEAISSFIEQANIENSLLIAEILGLNVKTIDKHTDEKPTLKTQQGILKSIGHKKATTTQKHYFSLQTKKPL